MHLWFRTMVKIINEIILFIILSVCHSALSPAHYPFDNFLNKQSENHTIFKSQLLFETFSNWKLKDLIGLDNHHIINLLIETEFSGK